MFSRRKSRSSVILLTLASITWLAIPEDGAAQFRGPRDRGGFRGDGDGRRGGFRRGFGGRGFGMRGSGSLMGALRRDSVQAELELTEAQKSQLEALQERLRSEGPSMRDVFRQMRDASEEERQALVEQMQEARRQQSEKADAELKTLLSEMQFTRLKQLALRETGPRALLQDDVAESLNLTNEQKQSIEAVFDRREEQRRGQFEQMREMSRDERQQFFENMREQTEQEALAVLTAEQRQKWEEQLGPPPAEDDGSSDRDDRSSDSTSIGRRGDDAGSDGSADGPSNGDGRGPSERPAGRFVLDESKPKSASFSISDDASAAAEEGSEEPSDAEAERESRDDPDELTTSETGQEMTLSFNFHDAPWPEVLKLFADAAGLTLHLRDIPSGTFTYYDPRDYTATEALDVMNRILLQDGYLLVQHDQFLTVFNTDEGIPPNLVETVSPDQLTSRAKTEYVTTVFSLGDREASATSEEVKALLGPQGTVAPLESANSLVVTDIAANLLRVKRFLEPPPKLADEELTFQSFALEHVAAQEAAQIIKNLFPVETAAQNNSAQAAAMAATINSSRSRWRGRGGFDPRRFFRGRGDRDDDDDRGSSGFGQLSNTTAPVAVAVDVRTNSVLVRARQADMKIVEEAVKALDVEHFGESLASAMAGQRPPDQPYLQVYPVNQADVDDVERTLRAVHPTAIINEDDDTDRLHVFANEEQHRQIAEQIRQIDGAIGGDNLAMIPLGGLAPADAVSMLSSLYLTDGANAPSLQVDPYGSRLIVKGSVSQVAQIQKLLQQYGGGDGAAMGRRQQGPVRTVPLGGRDPEEFARLLERLWSASGENPIRVLTPDDSSDSGPIRGRRTPTSSPQPQERRDQQSEEGPQVRRSGTTDRPEHRPQNVPAVFVSNAQSDDQPEQSQQPSASPKGQRRTDNQAPPTDAGESSNSESKPPIVVSIIGGELVISSQDEEALDRLQQLIGRVSRMLPNRTSWTVFYLRTADAVETATVLQQLLPAATGAGETLLPGLSASTGTGGLRIIPETRMNALFVTGPPEQVRDVESMLKILDSSELPESLRDRVPRMIPVLYADVNEVAEIIRDVYQDYLEPADSRSRSRGGPFFARSNNGSDSSSSQRNSGAPLTLGVDTQTSQLIVSSSEALFQQIEDLVQSLDEAAYEAERTVRVVGVNNANSAVVQDALNSLFPQVTVSTTASSGGAASGQPSAEDRDDRPRDADGDRAERIRRFMEMRRRMRESGGDRRGFFGRRGGDSDGRGRFRFNGRGGGGRDRGRRDRD